MTSWFSWLGHWFPKSLKVKFCLVLLHLRLCGHDGDYMTHKAPDTD